MFEWSSSERESNGVYFTNGDLPFGKALAVRRAERRMAPVADMPAVEVEINARLSTRSRLHVI
jgi:hypothetical protein